jgi:hypothetical protein
LNKILYKLLLGKPEYNFIVPHPAIKNQLLIIKRIWNNEEHNDIGLEKLLRLFLASIQFVFPAIYMRHLLWKKGYMYQSMAIELYVVTKTILPIVFLATGLYKNHCCIFIIFYLLAETICYISTLIFVSDQLVKSRSYRRSVLLLFVDYLQIVFDFAVIYGGLNLLKSKADRVLEFVYFSFVTSATIGFGDIFPTTSLGKVLVCFQSVLFLVFVVLFLNFFASRMEIKDFYDKQKEK